MAIVQTHTIRQRREQETATRASVEGMRRLSFRAMGTRCFVQYATPDAGQARQFEATALHWVQRFERRYSRFRDDSEISRINRAAGKEWVEVDEEMEHYLDLCGNIHFMTQGIIDPTAGSLTKLWNYQAEKPRLPDEDEIAATLALVGWKRVERRSGAVRLPEAGMALDFGGWGKELAVDMVARIAGEHGLTQVMVDFGHDIRTLGTPLDRPAWHIGLEDPEAPGTLAGSIALIDQAVASSGDYLRGFTHQGRRYGHIVDPRTGRPVSNGCRQVTVIAGSCLQAGILSTTAFVLGADEGLDFIQNTMGAEGLIVINDVQHQTRGFFQYVVS